MRDNLLTVESLLEAAENQVQHSEIEEAAALAAQAAEQAGTDGRSESQVQALLVLHQIRRMVGDERQATLFALHALRVAQNAGLKELADQAQAALLNHYALAFALWPMDQMLHDLRQAG